MVKRSKRSAKIFWRILIIFNFLIIAWYGFWEGRVILSKATLKPVTGPVELNCPHIKNGEIRLGSLIPYTGKALHNRIIPGISTPDAHLACADIALFDLLWNRAELKDDYFYRELFFKGIARDFLQTEEYRDDLFATILHRAVDQDIWKWLGWKDERIWLGMLYSNPSGRIYNPAMAEYQFRRLLIESRMPNPWIKPAQCLDVVNEEKAKPYYKGLRLKALEWFETLCTMSDDDLFQEAMRYESGQDGYPRDPYIALQLHYRSAHPDSRQAAQNLRELQNSSQQN